MAPERERKRRGRGQVYFIDANVPMYAVGAEHPLKGPCVAVLEAIARGELQAVTDAEVLQELLHRYSALGGRARARAVEICRLFLRVVHEVLPITKEVIEEALELHLKFPRLPARDSLHWAVMRRHSLKNLLSADRHFDGLPGLTRHDPADFPAEG